MSNYRRRFSKPDRCDDHCHDDHDHRHREPRVEQHNNYMMDPKTPDYFYGKDGERGPRGKQGEQGCRGYAGKDGLDGEPGPAGPEGPQGIQGEKGCQGDVGERGATGDRGEQGIQGIQGDTGCQGPVGPQGIQGPRGDEGPRGEQGAQGIAGPAGATGATGSVGATGPQGPQGIEGDQGDTGPIGLTGAQGEQGIQGIQGIAGEDGDTGPQGPSGFVSCTFDETLNCYDVQLRLADGSTKDAQFSGCFTLLACGYIGNPICATNADVTITQQDSNRLLADITWTVPGGTLTSTMDILDTISSGTTTFNDISFQGDSLCVDVTTTGKLAYKHVYDKSGLPITEQECSSPLDGIFEIDGLVSGGGQPTSIDKRIGGAVTQTGFTEIGNNVFEVASSPNTWLDDIRPKVFGGLGGNLIGDNFSVIVDTFSDNQQRFLFCEQVCYYQPVEFETDGDGNIIPGTAVDANGNPVADGSFVAL